MNELLQHHPGYEALLQEAALLREELVHLLAEEHALLHFARPHLLALYQQKIGAWELQRLHAHIAERRAQRRLEMAQAAINQGQPPQLAEIDGMLELEFLTWEQKLKEAAAALDTANQHFQHLLSEDDDRELKKLYHALVKKLHPDVNPDATGAQSRLWLRRQAAYEAGHLQELRALSLLAGKEGDPTRSTSTLDALRQDCATLRTQIDALLKRLQVIESQPPFTLRALLEDEAWVGQRRQEIEAQTAHLAAHRAALEAQLQTLLPVSDDGKLFGLN